MTVEDVYKTKSKLFRLTNWPAYFVTVGKWSYAVTYDEHEQQISTVADLSGLMDSDKLKTVAPANEEEYRDFVKVIFNKDIEFEL